MSRVLGILAGLPLVCGLVVMATNANAQVEPGPWKPDNPTFTVQQKGSVRSATNSPAPTASSAPSGGMPRTAAAPPSSNLVGGVYRR
jgi:hypothetical protein